MKLLIGGLSHETNTFCREPTGEADFAARYIRNGEEIPGYFKGTRTPVGGFLDACEDAGVTVIPAVCASATPGGRVTRAFFDRYLRAFDAIASEHAPYDGLLLGLHGAMVLEDSPDGEGDLLSWIRTRPWGRGVPVMATLDFHANVTPAMVENATAMFGFDEYPHTDGYERGLEAGRAMVATVQGRSTPVLSFRRIPILCPLIPTADPPMSHFLARAHQWEREPDVISVSVLAGFPWADVPGAGMSVLCVTEGNPDLGRRVAGQMADEVWQRRGALVRPLVPVEEAVGRAMAAQTGTVLLADVADNPGAGCPGDGTVLLRALIERDAESVGLAILPDPETVDQARRAGVGATIEVRLGGKIAPDLGGPIVVSGRVKALTDGVFRNGGPMNAGLVVRMGNTAVIEVGRGIEVIVTERRMQPLDAAVFDHAGLDIRRKRVLVVKSSVHFRASFEGRVDEIIDVDAPGLISMNFHRFSYRDLSRPVYPLDAEIAGAETCPS